jgi:serine/threonine protein kinase
MDAAHKKSIVKLAEGPIGGPDETVTQGLTQQGQIVGTRQYMSPEQLHGKEVDSRSDLFSFGCVLYEMLSGKRAFDGKSAASVSAAVLEREREALKAVNAVLRSEPAVYWHLSEHPGILEACQRRSTSGSMLIVSICVGTQYFEFVPGPYRGKHGFRADDSSTRKRSACSRAFLRNTFQTTTTSRSYTSAARSGTLSLQT